MALDKNLFTLNIEQSKIEPTSLDLVDPSGTVHYRKRWTPNEAGTYAFSLVDPLSDSVLATAAAPSPTSKEKVIELHNPTVIVPLTFKGALTFKWNFVWEEHQFQWKRESCYMIRKPDPPVLVAVTKEPAGRIKTSTVQILDYNLNRFDIDDRKGLEIVLLTSLLTFRDQSDQLHAKPGEAASPPAGVSLAVSTPPPPPPPKPEGWTGDQIAIIQAKEQREINEVVIAEAGAVEDYTKHCVELLNDDTLLFITLRSHSAECVSKVVQVAEATKRTRYKSGAYDQELHQYVDMSFEDDNAPAQGKGKGKAPRVINLDDRPNFASSTLAPGSKAYKPPNTLTIHLSKIAMPELEPKARKGKPPGSHSKTVSEPKSKSAQTYSHEKQSSAGSATLSKPRPASPPPTSSNSGLRAKLSAFTRTSSSPPESRPSSASQSQPLHSNHPKSSSQSPPQSPYPSHSQARPSSANGPSRPPHSPAGPAPHLQHANSHSPAPHLRPQSGIYGPPGSYPPFPGRLMNVPPQNPPNPIFALYPSAFATPPVSTHTGPPGGVQRASGAGFLDNFKLVRR